MPGTGLGFLPMLWIFQSLTCPTRWNFHLKKKKVERPKLEVGGSGVVISVLLYCDYISSGRKMCSVGKCVREGNILRSVV